METPTRNRVHRLRFPALRHSYVLAVWLAACALSHGTRPQAAAIPDPSGARGPALERFRASWPELGVHHWIERVEDGYRYTDLCHEAGAGTVSTSLVEGLSWKIYGPGAAGVDELDASLVVPAARGSAWIVRVRGRLSPDGRFVGWVATSDGSHAGPVSVELPRDPRVRDHGHGIVLGVIGLGLLVHRASHDQERSVPHCDPHAPAPDLRRGALPLHGWSSSLRMRNRGRPLLACNAVRLMA